MDAQVVKVLEPKVRISYDEMEAWLYLPKPEGNTVYTVDSLVEILAENGVRHGVDRGELERIIKEPVYNWEVSVAKGTKEKDGKNGYFEYHFNTTFDKKPKINPDGTVDYWSINTVEMVEEGQLLVTYHEPITGENGMSVKGKVRIAKRGRPMIPLRGKGFTRSQDNLHYYADFDGKVEIQSDRLVVSPVYEISGNADLSVGNIDFKGDVIVHGDVSRGIHIHAAGSVTIDGLAEACTIVAGKDVTIRGGMMGDHRGSIVTQGQLNGKFFEYCNIEAEGSVSAASFYGCQVSSKDRITVSGNKSAIVGGAVYAVCGVSVSNVGNDSEVATEIHAGVSRAILLRIKELTENSNRIDGDLKRVEEGIAQFDQVSLADGVDMKNDPRRIALLRTKIMKQADLATINEELRELEELVENSRGASITVEHHVNPGVQLFIGDLRMQIKDPQYAVEFRVVDDKLMMYSLYN